MGKKTSRRINLFLNKITLPYIFVVHFWIAFCILLGSKNGGPVPNWAAYILIILMILECILIGRSLWIMNIRENHPYAKYLAEKKQRKLEKQRQKQKWVELYNQGILTCPEWID